MHLYKHLLTDAALDLVHPGHKNLSWLSGVDRIQAHSLFKEEVLLVWTLMLPVLLMISLMSNLQAKIALDAFFDFDMHDMQVLDA